VITYISINGERDERKDVSLDKSGESDDQFRLCLAGYVAGSNQPRSTSKAGHHHLLRWRRSCLSASDLNVTGKQHSGRGLSFGAIFFFLAD